MSNTIRNRDRFTAERDALLMALWETDIPSSDVLDRWNALPGEPTNYYQLSRHARRLGMFRPVGSKSASLRASVMGKPRMTRKSDFAVNEASDKIVDKLIRAASDTFGALPVLMTDHPGLSVSDPLPSRYRSIMERPDPTMPARVAARAEQARRTRLGRVYDSGGMGL